MAFKKVETKTSFPKMEEDILKYWENKGIFEKSVEKNPDEKTFIFYEGPPTANGKPGLHHVLARAFKDVIPRYKTMKGFRVERKAGWDTHGLPVELQVEKALGLKSKQEIENIVPGDPRQSIIEFNKRCKESVWEYKEQWEKLTRRMAFWVDMDDPYVTYENKYIESVWWVIAQIAGTKNEKGESLIYKGHKVIPYCYRCGTALSSHEVAQGYQTVKDDSVYLKFKTDLKKLADGMDGEAYFLAWTTTPWTLPGNVALSVGKNIRYALVKFEDAYYILAKDRISEVFKDKSVVTVREIGADELIGLRYEPLFKTNDTGKKAYYVVTGDFVSTEDGTGIVHIAPAFGEDDANVGRANDLPTLITVDLEGKISAEVPGKGIAVKKKNEKNKYTVDSLIKEDLERRNLLFREEVYEHEYPFCWRCDTPLIYYAKPSWFIRMSELANELVKNNLPINWVPSHIRDGRFGEWLTNVKDWAISRERYWGTPLPIWECGKCHAIKTIGSRDELEKLSGQKLDDLHRPYIDDPSFKCRACQGEMKRTPEVMDVWFDSGSMPLAQWHYPHYVPEAIKEKIENGKYFPADYICEAIDQTRGWFYTLHAIATLLHKSKKVPAGQAFKNVICLGHILDAQGKKMSKSRGNIVEPMAVMDEYGADMLRWMLFTINQPGLPKRFDIKGMRDIMNRVFRMVWNSYSFFVMYANIDNFQSRGNVGEKNLLDRWIVSELNGLIREADKKLESYDVYGAAKPIEKFIDNLSNWYIRRSRKRFWKSENDTDKNDAYETLHFVLVTLAKLMAPFTPFIAEEMFKNLTGEESVHLADFPTADEKRIDEKLNRNMEAVREIISEGLQKRAVSKIKVRQPLNSVSLGSKYQELFNTMFDKKDKDFFEIMIMDELNVEHVSINILQGVYNSDDQVIIETDLDKYPELKLKGQAREIIRFIQEMRKEAGYEVDNRIKICYAPSSVVFEKYGPMIAKETLAEELSEGEIPEADLKKEFNVDGLKINITLKNLN